MSDNKLNPAQQAAADFPHTSPAVVTAAAGSGKTTLLVERVIRLLSDRSLDIKADSLGVMTFTRNATKSLREKLNSALSKKIADLAEDSSEDAAEQRSYLSEQMFALRQASISTIDSFCLKMIRENPEAFDLPVNFTVADAAKKTSLQMQAIKMAMQDFYDDKRENAFSEEERNTLFFSFNYENDDDLKASIIGTADRLSAYADAESWLNGAADVYKDIDTLEKEYLDVFKPAADFAVSRARDMFALYEDLHEELLSQAEERRAQLKNTKSDDKKRESLDYLINTVAPAISQYIAFDTKRMELIDKHYAEYCKAPSLETLGALFTCLNEYSENPVAVDSSRGAKVPARTAFTAAKNGFRSAVEGLLKFGFSKKDEEENLPVCRLAVKSFIKLLKIYMGYFNQLKMSSGAIEFSDCELLLLQKLRSDEKYREQLSKRFGCIIIDEFQDSNDIQAEIFRLLGGGKLFYVGDVKQSIYAFRGGNPSIMANLARKEGFTELPLNINYRSRKAVIDTVNATFSELMTEQYGGVDYAGAHELQCGADYPEISEENKKKYCSEIVLLTSGDEDDEKDMTAARYVANRIRELHDDESFLITEDGIPRRCEYSDFAVLLRYNTKIPQYRAALAELRISSEAPKGKHFLDTDEIRLITNYLRVIDNPLKDEEMLKTLMSPIYRFNAEETAQLRLGTLGVDLEELTEQQTDKVAKACRRYSLYNCLRLCTLPLDLANFGESGIIPRTVNPKAARFMNDLKAFRYYMNSNSLDDLIMKIYEDTDITAVVAAFEDSAQRVSNVRRLQRLARDFESRDGGNLSDFLRFLDRASENSKNGIEEAAHPQSTADAVRIMTFHGSKGLEVPVCIMAELQTKLNDSDFSGTLLMNREHYMALMHTDIKRRFKSKTFAYCALERLNRQKMIGEELRLLYVAMTRAREKLIMTAKTSVSALTDKKYDSGIREEIFGKNVPFRWILSSLLRYLPDNFEVPAKRSSKSKDKNDGKSEDEKPVTVELKDIGCTINEVLAQNIAPPPAAARKEYDDISDEEVNELLAAMNSEYSFAAETRQQAKFTVTELAHQKSVRPVNLIKPAFASGGKPSGTEKGNAYHHAMQYFPLDLLGNGGDLLESVKKALHELADAGKITAREADIVEAEHIARFFQSELGQRMLKSSEIVREKAFYSEIAGTEVGQEYGGRISIQGQIDLYFVEDGGIVVVDYKSDTAANLEEERENYAQQVKIYSKMLPELTGKPIKEMYLYAFLADKAIKI